MSAGGFIDNVQTGGKICGVDIDFSYLQDVLDAGVVATLADRNDDIPKPGLQVRWLAQKQHVHPSRTSSSRPSFTARFSFHSVCHRSVRV